MKFSLIYSPVSFWENWIAKYTSFRYSSDIWIPISLEKKMWSQSGYNLFWLWVGFNYNEVYFSKGKKSSKHSICIWTKQV